MSVADCTRDPEVEYRDIPGFPGYQIGSDGTVWTAWCGTRKPRIGTKWIRKGERVHRGKRPGRTTDRIPYHSVVLSRNAEHFVRFVHRIVLETFRGPCPENCETRHLDGNPENNRLDNLEWGTKADNWQDRYRHGSDTSGERSGLAILAENDVRRIRQLKSEGRTNHSIAQEYCVSRYCIDNVISRRSWASVE